MIYKENISKRLLGMMLGGGVSAVVYIVGLKIRLRGGKLLSYQGISEATLLHPIGWYIKRFIDSFKDIFNQIFITDIYQNRYAMIAVSIIWIIMAALFICRVFHLLRKGAYACVFLACISVALIPISAYFMKLFSDGVAYYGLMLTSISIVWILPIMILDTINNSNNEKRRNIVFALLLICIMVNLWNYIIVDNISYLASSVANSKSYALSERIVDRIEQTEGYEDMEYVYLHGKVSDKGYTHWAFEGKSIINDGIIPYGNTTYILYIRNCIGVSFPMLSDSNKMEELQSMPEFIDMPVWPNSGCTKLIDNVMVVKLSE